MTAPFPGLQRLIEKKTALGAIRELTQSSTHIGLREIAPFLEVATDDVIFEYIKDGLTEGLAPARAEDAESELAQKDEMASITGRASLIDWTLKDTYTPGDVTQYRDGLLIQQAAQGIAGLSMPVNGASVGRTTQDFISRVTRDDGARKKKLDNRIEWLIMRGLEDGRIVYNDGKISFKVDFKRPANQQNQAPMSGKYFDDANGDGDPIGDIRAMNQYMYETYGINLKKAYISTRILQEWWKSKKFLAATNLSAVFAGSTTTAPIDINYINPAFGPDSAAQIISNATGVQFTVYDAFYRTRALGTQNSINNRYTSDDKIIFMPDDAALNEINDTELGFAKTLTSPHVEGNWTSGFYEWEQERRDPWAHDRGTGIKAFPIFPMLEYTYVMQALDPA